MKVRAWQQAVALALSFEMAFAPVLAGAREIPHPKFPKASELGSNKYVRLKDDRSQFDAMILRGELPNFGEDDYDPQGTRGQYARWYDRAGNIISQYFFDEAALNRKAPRGSKLRPRLETNELGQQCLVIEATAGEDVHGNHGYVVGRIFAPRFCGVVGMHLDKEVLTLVNGDGTATLIDWAYVRSQGFRGGVWGAVRAFVPEFEDASLVGHDVKVITKTPGMKPTDWENSVEGAVLPPFDEDGEPETSDGDLFVFRDGKFFAWLPYESSRKMLLVEQIKIQLVIAKANGAKRDMQRLRESLEFMKERFDNHQALLEDANVYATDIAVAAMAYRMDEPARNALHESARAFRNHYDRERFPYSNRVHRPVYEKIVEGGEQLMARAPKVEGKVDPEPGTPEYEEYLRTNWQMALAGKFQTMDERLATLNEKTSSRVFQKIWDYRTVAAALAAFGAWVYMPNAIEQSPFLQRFAFINWIYRHSPDVLKIKHEAYRGKLYASIASLTALTALPSALSGLSAVVLKTLDRATLGSKSAFAQYVRDLSDYWADQGTWQRLATFGAQFGSKFAVSPFIRVMENVFQQKAFLSSVRAGIAPWRVVKPTDPLGQKLGLTEPQMVGLMRPSFKGAVRKLRRSLPGVTDPDAEAWEAERLRGKQRLQAEIYDRNQRRRRYARLLSTLIVAQDSGVDAADISALLELGIKNNGLTVAQIQEYITDERKLNNQRMAEVKLFKEMHDLAWDFNHDEQMRDVDLATMLSYGDQAKEIVRALNADGAYAHYKRLGGLAAVNAKEAALQVWDAALTHGQALEEANSGLIADRNVSKNMQEQFPPDHLMVSDVPAVTKVPGLPNRTDFAHPDSMAADINGSYKNLWSTGQHLQDVIFNFIMQGLQGPAMTMRQFQKKKPETEELYRSYHDIMNLVVARRDGQLAFRLPERTNAKTDHYRGNLSRQSFGDALKDYWKALKSIDFGAQAKAGMSTMHETFWLYTTMQFIARWGFGGQPAGPAIIGLLFAFQASQICYKPLWWVINPTNNTYDETIDGRVDEFMEARRWLSVAETMPAGQRRAVLQDRGVDKLHEIFSVKKPAGFEAGPGQKHELPAERTTESRERLARAYKDLADTGDPGGLLPNTKMTSSVNVFGGFATTVAAIPMLTVSNLKHYMTIPYLVATWAVSYAWQFVAINFLGHNPRGRNFVKAEVKRAATTVRGAAGRMRERAGQAVRSCQDSLTGGGRAAPAQ